MKTDPEDRDRAEANTFIVGFAALAMFALMYLLLNPIVIKLTEQYKASPAAQTQTGSDAIGYATTAWGIGAPLFILIMFFLFIIAGALYGSQV